MSKITLPASLNSTKLQTTQRLDGSDTVDVQHVMPANPIPLTSGNIAAIATAIVADVTDAGLVAFQVSGVYTGLNLSFEVSINGTDWFPVLCLRSDKSALESTSGVIAGLTRAWVCEVNAFRQFRVRSSAWSSGTAAIVIAPTPSAIEPDPYITLAASANTIGNVGVATKTTGGATPGKLISAATTNATSVKVTPGTLYSLHASNNSASWRYLKLYNKASAPVVGTDTPVMTIGLPPASSPPIALPADIGVAFSTGIALAITGALADADATAVGANEVVVNYAFA